MVFDPDFAHSDLEIGAGERGRHRQAVADHAGEGINLLGRDNGQRHLLLALESGDFQQEIFFTGFVLVSPIPDHVHIQRAALNCTHADIGAHLCEQWHLPRYLSTTIAASEPPAEPADVFQRCVALSGCIADIWLAQDADAAREHALQQVHRELGMDSQSFELVLQRIDQSLPDLCNMLDVAVPCSARVRQLLDHANELKELRNLREMQDMSAARQRAEAFEFQARQLSEQAHLDGLTGVLNRRQLEAVLEQEFLRAGRQGWPLSVAFIDLDDFKKINDAHGHLTGDEDELPVVRQGADLAGLEQGPFDLRARHRAAPCAEP